MQLQRDPGHLCGPCLHLLGSTNCAITCSIEGDLGSLGGHEACLGDSENLQQHGHLVRAAVCCICQANIPRSAETCSKKRFWDAIGATALGRGTHKNMQLQQDPGHLCGPCLHLSGTAKCAKTCSITVDLVSLRGNSARLGMTENLQQHRHLAFLSVH